MASLPIAVLRSILQVLRQQGKVLVAVLYGSYARGEAHARSDIDLALFLNANRSADEIEIIDQILMALDTEVSILRLDDDDESPFVVQEALKGIHLVEPDTETLYAVWHRVLHECESIRFRRGLKIGQIGSDQQNLASVSGRHRRSPLRAHG